MCWTIQEYTSTPMAWVAVDFNVSRVWTLTRPMRPWPGSGTSSGQASVRSEETSIGAGSWRRSRNGTPERCPCRRRSTSAGAGDRPTGELDRDVASESAAATPLTARRAARCGGRTASTSARESARTGKLLVRGELAVGVGRRAARSRRSASTRSAAARLLRKAARRVRTFGGISVPRFGRDGDRFAYRTLRTVDSTLSQHDPVLSPDEGRSVRR